MNTKYTEEERADMKAQARFVRAYYYWLLLRKYGPVPLLPDEGLDYTPIMMIWQFNVVRMMNVWNILNRRCVWQPRICL